MTGRGRARTSTVLATAVLTATSSAALTAVGLAATAALTLPSPGATPSALDVAAPGVPRPVVLTGPERSPARHSPSTERPRRRSGEDEGPDSRIADLGGASVVAVRPPLQRPREEFVRGTLAQPAQLPAFVRRSRPVPSRPSGSPVPSSPAAPGTPSGSPLGQGGSPAPTPGTPPVPGSAPVGPESTEVPAIPPLSPLLPALGSVTPAPVPPPTPSAPPVEADARP